MKIVLYVLLVGHVLGDFYCQTDNMVEKRKVSFRYVLLHSLMYLVTMIAVVVIGFVDIRSAIIMALLSGLAHFVIDAVKYLVTHSEDNANWIHQHLFLIDQCAHMISLIVICSFFQNTQVRELFLQKVIHGQYELLTVVLGLLCILKPVSILITESNLWQEKAAQKRETDQASNEKTEDVKEAGIIIGYMERGIIFFLLMYGQYSAMAFVLTAKSIARVKEIEESRVNAEYYLIGTLFSITCVIVISALLGLCG